MELLAPPAIDAAMFAPVRLPGALGLGGYIELSAAERMRESDWRMDGSLCVRDAAFDFVGGCFEVASAGFDLLSSSRLSVAETASLSCELGAFASTLEQEPGRAALFSRYASMMNPAVWSQVDASGLRAGLLSLVRALHRYSWVAAAHKRPLWVLGV
jgi:hypothetical protein